MFALVALGSCSKGGDDTLEPILEPTYTLTVTSNEGGGAEIIGEDGQSVTTLTTEANTELLLTARPNEGYLFAGWDTIGANGEQYMASSDNPMELLMHDSDIEYKAVFWPQEILPRPIVSTDEALIAQLLSETVDTLTIGDHSFTLRAEVWRDFSLIIIFSYEDAEKYRNKSAMTSFNWLIETHQAKIPEYIDFKKQYVIHDDSIWIADYENVGPPPLFEYVLKCASFSGPKWDIGICVDVIAQVLNTQTQTSYYVLCKNIPIKASL